MTVNPAVLQSAQSLLLASSGTDGADVLSLSQRSTLTPDELARAQGILAATMGQLTETAQRRTLLRLDLELQKLAQSGTPPETRRLAAIEALRDGTTPARLIAPEWLHVTESGGLVFLGAPDSAGKPQNIVMRTVPWVTKEIFTIGGAVLYLVADARLDLSTGRHATDTEFPGYRARFIDGRQASIALFEDEAPRYRRILELSYDGGTWNPDKATLAQFYPPEVAALVPDLGAEAAELRAKYGVEDDGDREGIWDLSRTLERGGRLAFGEVDIVHQGEGRWSLLEGGIYLGDIDYRAHPIREPKVRFMESVIASPQGNQRRYQALVEGRPTFVSLGGGSGFTKAKASSHLKIDMNGDVILWDPNVEVVADLARLGIPLSRVKHIVVSHAHFDHVAGLWQLIRRLPKKPKLHIQVNPDDINHIHSGRSVTADMEMSMLMTLIDMAVQATGGSVTGAELLNAVEIEPMKFHQNTQLGTYTVQFYHSNHSHPTTPYFMVDPQTGRPIFLFTGDARLDATALFKAVQAGAMTGERAQFLSSLVPVYLARGAVVVGDAGVPPLHPTPAYYRKVRELLTAQGMSGDDLERALSHLYTYHEDREKVATAGLQHVGWGWETAIDLAEQTGWTRPREAVIQQNLLHRGLSEVPLFTNLTVRDMDDLKKMVAIRRFRQGEVLMEQGETADTMMALLDGAVEVRRSSEGGGTRSLGTLTAALLGEGVFADQQTRNATVEALTDVIVAVLGKPAQDFLKAKGVAAKAVDLRELRTLVDGSNRQAPILEDVSALTRDMILLSCEVEKVPAGTVLMNEGERGGDLYFILEGDVEVSAREGSLSESPVTLSRGAVIGEGALMGQGVRGARITALTHVQYIRLGEDRVRELMDQSGGDFNYFLLGLVQQRRVVARSS